jgi:type VI secretion system secreted protein Hcp
MLNRRILVAAFVLSFVMAGAGHAFAQIRTFMLIPGIPGAATDAQHDGWIDVLSMSQGASTAKRSVSCSDFSIFKSLDQAGPALWGAAAAGQVFNQIRVEVVKSTADKPVVIYDIRLNTARVTAINTSGSSEIPTESVSFSYQSLTLTFNQQTDAGVVIPGTPQTINCQ